MIQPPVTLSPDRVASLRQKHVDIPSYGGTLVHRFADLVRDFVGETGARTALDYCCGKGLLADLLVADGTLQSVHKYDVGIEQFSVPCPHVVDVAWCNHALYEFAPEHFVAALRYLRGAATRGVFISFQWGEPQQGSLHWRAPMQDADWVYGAMRQYWPSHRVLDSGPSETLRQFIFTGFVEPRRWIK